MTFPIGTYANANRDINDVVGGMAMSTSWGIEWKTRVFNMGNTKFGEYSFIDYLDKGGAFFQFNHFQCAVPNESLENIKNQQYEISHLGNWKVSSILAGITQSDYIGDDAMAAFKIGGGITQVSNPSISLTKNQELMYYREGSVFNTFGALIGLDLMIDIGRIKLQLQNELFWTRPEIVSVTRDFEIGELDNFRSRESLWLPQIKIAIGYNFME
jgi:hypothetical protein